MSLTGKAAKKRREPVKPPVPRTVGGAELKAAMGPVGRFVMALVFTLFWNGVVSVFLVGIVGQFRAGRGPWFQALFLVPFVLVGLGVMVLTVWYFLALFNPRPRVKLTPAAVPLGGSARVEWEITGNASRIRTLSLTLEGREEATYRRGTDSTTARSVFARVEVASGDQYGNLQRGSAKLEVPKSGMHSFASANNKILWVVKVQGEIARWPDVEEELPFEVLPAERP